MNEALLDPLFRGFAIFCRIGTCLMLMPGFSSPRVPVMIRLFVCLSLSLALYMRLSVLVGPVVAGQADELRFGLLLSECAIGGLIGLTARYFFMGLEMAFVLAANAIGMAYAFTVQISEEGSVPALATLASLSVSMLFFITNQHLEVIRALVQSYEALPPVNGFMARPALMQVVDALARSFVLALRAGAPFFVYGVLINLISGLLNKLVPNIPVYFILTPLVVALGLMLVYFTIAQSLDLFMLGFSDWLRG